jgi:Flp pilus assembly protein protease CpaA
MLVKIGIGDVHSRRIPNKTLLALLVPVVALIAVVHHFSLGGLIACAVIAAFCELLFFFKAWGGGDAKLVMVLSLLLIVMPSSLWAFGALYVFMMLMALGLAGVFLTLKIMRRSTKKPPGGLAFILPGTAMWMLLLAAYH